MSAPRTLAGLLARAAESERGVRFLDRRERPRFVSYRELQARAEATAAGLRARGIEPGDRVGLLLPTGPEFYDAFFGALRAGAVPVPLYPPVRLARLEEYRVRTAALLRGCRARVVLGDARTAGAIGRAVRDAAPAFGFALVADLREAGEAGGTGATGGVDAGGDRLASPDGVALVQHSSGTTGAPRPVRLTHAAVLTNIEAIRRRILDAYPDDEVDHATVSWLPLYHDMGLIGCVLTSLAHPVDLTLLPPELFVSRPGAWLRAMSRYGGTVSGAPNFAYAYCAERIARDELDELDLSGWKIALSGAEPVTPSTLSAFAETFAPVGFRPEALTPVYGLAEATLAVTFSEPRERWRERTISARPGAASVTLVALGTPLPGVRLRIAAFDDADRTLPDGDMGRVMVGGLSLFDGYDDDPGARPGAWFDTGDTGLMLDGELYLYGRTKDVIILRGQKHAPHDIEAALAGTPGLRAGCAAAIGAPLEEGGDERLVVLAERARANPPAADPTLASALRERVVERTGLTVGRVVIVDPGSLPRTSSGKIRRAEARRRWLAGELAAAGDPGALGLAAEVVRSRIALARLNREVGP